MNNGIRPKAYAARVDFMDSIIVVWAETASKARKIAYDEISRYDDLAYTDVRVKRLPKMDLMYKGEEVADWNDPEIRVALVKEYGWYCSEPCYSECKTCPAKNYCEYWAEGMVGE